jgi:hypothetical protein
MVGKVAKIGGAQLLGDASRYLVPPGDDVTTQAAR